MIGAFQTDQSTLFGASNAMAGEPGELDRALDGFGPAVGKEHAVQAGERGQFLGQPSLVLVVVQIRDVDEASRLLANRFDDSWVRVAQRIHSKAGNEVEILLAAGVVQKNTLATFEGNRVAVIGLEKITAFKIGNLFEVWHGNQDFT